MPYKILHKINNPKQLKKLKLNELDLLSYEIRKFIIYHLSKTSGHLGSNLGIVEITVAIHYYYNTPHDLLIWDVGHQCYPHKIICERKNKFNTLRKFNGISGFPRISESKYDIFGTGHSSTSISAILGMAIADEINNIKRERIVVIGDASISSGISFEALNNINKYNITILLNDNGMSISENIGGLYLHLKKINKKNNIFTNLGIKYLGPIDGHNIYELIKYFKIAKQLKGPKIIHIKTTKGKGFKNAELDKIKWHAPGKFNITSGEIYGITEKKKTYQDVLGDTLYNLLQINKKIVLISPAMILGSNLSKCKEKFNNRVIDVGISEQHSITLSAGLSCQGIIPYCIIYSTFLQRGYDQIIHDIALQNLPVVICIDRCGIVGEDGATHHGYFDISFLRSIPNIIISSPSNEHDLINILYSAQYTKQPFCIRLPKNEIKQKYYSNKKYEIIKLNKYNRIFNGDKIAIISTGIFSSKLEKIITNNNLQNFVTLIDLIFIKPINKKILIDLSNKFNKITTFEDGILNGGIGISILKELKNINYKGIFKINCMPDKFIEHGKIKELEKYIKLDDKSILKKIKKYINI